MFFDNGETTGRRYPKAQGHSGVEGNHIAPDCLDESNACVIAVFVAKL